MPDASTLPRRQPSRAVSRAVSRAPAEPAAGPATEAASRPARPSRRALLLDGLLALGFLAAMLLERARAAGEIGERMPAAVVLGVVVAAALAVRRLAPLTGYLVGTAALSAEALFVQPGVVSPYANLVGLHALGLYATRGRARWGPPVVVVGMAAYFSGLAHTYPVIPVGVLGLWLAAWALGYGTARRQEEREGERRAARERALAEERARVARDVHDLLGHTLNLMLVQAGAARRLLDRDPDHTRELLHGLEDTGREALGELDRVLGLLRHTRPADPHPGGPTPGHPHPGGPAPGHPAPAGAEPGLADLPRLLARMEQAGIRVTTRLDPAALHVPSAVDRCAYRIVQEALTNTVKHARATAAEVTVDRDGRGLSILVSDDGRGAAAGYTPGRGLLGIAERVAPLAGRVEHGAGDRGGFRLHVVLPLP